MDLTEKLFLKHVTSQFTMQKGVEILMIHLSVTRFST